MPERAVTSFTVCAHCGPGNVNDVTK